MVNSVVDDINSLEEESTTLSLLSSIDNGITKLHKSIESNVNVIEPTIIPKQDTKIVKEDSPIIDVVETSNKYEKDQLSILETISTGIKNLVGFSSDSLDLQEEANDAERSKTRQAKNIGDKSGFSDMFSLGSLTGGLSKLSTGIMGMGKALLGPIAIVVGITDFIETMFDDKELSKITGKEAKNLNIGEKILASLSSVVETFTLGFIKSEDVYQGMIQPLLDELDKGFKFLFDPEKGLFGPITDFIVKTMDLFDSDDLFNDTINLIKDIPATSFKLIGNLFDGIFDILPDGFNEVIKDLGSKVSDLSSNVVLSIKDSFSNVYGMVTNFFGNIYDSVSGYVAEVVNNISGFIKSNITDKVTNLMDSVSNGISGLFDGGIFGYITELPNKLNDSLSELMDNFSFSGVIEGIGKVLKFIHTLPLRIIRGSIDGVSGMVTSLLGGDSKIAGLISSGASSVTSFLSNIIGDSKDTNKIESPTSFVNNDTSQKITSTPKAEASIVQSPNISIKNNVPIAKERFNERQVIKERVIEKQPIVMKTDSNKQTNQVVRRTYSPDLLMSSINSGLMDS